MELALIISALVIGVMFSAKIKKLVEDLFEMIKNAIN